MLERAKEIAHALNGSVKFMKADGFELPFRDSSFDVTFHQGLLEHFDDEQIAALLSEQLRVSRSVVFSVPNRFYKRKDFGDERLLSKAEWEWILAKFRVVESRCYHKSGVRPKWLFGLKRRRKTMYLARIERSASLEGDAAPCS